MAVRLLTKASQTRQFRSESWRWVSEIAPPEKVIPTALVLSRRGHYELAAAILAGMDYGEAPSQQRRRIARALSYGGQHESAISLFEDVIVEQELDVESYADDMRTRDARGLGLAELHLTANNYVEKMTAPMGAQLNGFVVIYNVSNPVLTGLMVPLVRPLMQQGYGVVALTLGTLASPPFGVPDFDSLQGCIAPDGKSLTDGPQRKLSQAWRVDWVAGIAEVGGINYFPYFQERLSQKARRYRADILSDTESARRFVGLQLQADVALQVCEKLLALATHDKPIRIALMDSHFAPQGILREWCNHVGREHDIHTVALGVGYENYFSNLTSLEATTLAVEDLTAQPELRQPFLGGQHRMRAALAENPQLDGEPDGELMSWICQDRSNARSSSPGPEHVRTTAHSVRAGGGKVFVALGKVSIDFAAPGDRGFVHSDFESWINHLIEAISDTDNLLLIKPHPHELRKEIVVEGVQPLRELVVTNLPRNVLFLDHDSFNTHELADFIDAAFVWNGTAALEFSVLGIPVFPASVWASRDYPVGLQILHSREEYEEVLQGKRILGLSADVKRRAAAFLRLMRSDQVAIPYRYLRRAATNLSVGPPTLDLDSLLELEKSPDPFVQRASSRFFEFS